MLSVRKSEIEGALLDIVVPSDRYYVDGDEVVLPMTGISRDSLLDALLAHKCNETPAGKA